MKRVTLILLLITLLSTAILTAQEQAPIPNGSVVKEGLKNASLSLNDKVNLALENDIQIPLYMDKPARILFGIKDGDKFNMQILLILISFFLFFFIISYEVGSFLKIGRGPTSILFSVVFTSLLSWTGSFKHASNFMISLSSKLFLIKESRILAILLALGIFFAFHFFLSRLLESVRKGRKLKKSEEDGIAVGKQIALTRARAKRVRH